MKEFILWDEDDFSQLPNDFKLVPFNVAFIDSNVIETPKTSTSKMSPWVPKPSKSAKPVSNNQAASG